MKNLQPYETELLGDWVVSETQVEGDEACKRIQWLIAEKLQEIATDFSGWDVLYRDPSDGRYWELTYPQSHMHGGGPPALQCVSEYVAGQKYGQGDRK